MKGDYPFSLSVIVEPLMIGYIVTLLPHLLSFGFNIFFTTMALLFILFRSDEGL
jgi:hypothetical protein